MITIVDYGVGNIASLVNIFEFLGFRTELADTPEAIEAATHLVLPGVGAFDRAVLSLTDRGLVDPIRQAAAHHRIPLLGVCLGMQLLGQSSAEGVADGLGLIQASAERIEAKPGLKVPHIGWASITPTGSSSLFPRTGDSERFYFVHSYHMVCAHDQDIAATVDYGSKLTVAVSHGNIHGVQFHPEKSHRFGMRFLRSFAELPTCARA